MTSGRRETAARRRARGRRAHAAGLLVLATAVATVGYQLLASSSSTASSTSTETETATTAARSELPGPRGMPRRVLGEADGAVPDGTTAFDDGVPGVANLDPALLASLRRAATDARAEGLVLLVDSGWRSPAYQERLLRQAIIEYGSEREAARWVATPATSAHVLGEAVDIGPSDAAAWLSVHGVDYGLCRIYRNEPWHFELRQVDRGCPRMYADPTQDPRLRQ